MVEETPGKQPTRFTKKLEEALKNPRANSARISDRTAAYEAWIKENLPKHKELVEELYTTVMSILLIAGVNDPKFMKKTEALEKPVYNLIIAKVAMQAAPKEVAWAARQHSYVCDGDLRKALENLYNDLPLPEKDIPDIVELVMRANVRIIDDEIKVNIPVSGHAR